jgi:hypothetical protein
MSVLSRCSRIQKTEILFHLFFHSMPLLPVFPSPFLLIFFLFVFLLQLSGLFFFIASASELTLKSQIFQTSGSTPWTGNSCHRIIALLHFLYDNPEGKFCFGYSFNVIPTYWFSYLFVTYLFTYVMRSFMLLTPRQIAFG